MIGKEPNQAALRAMAADPMAFFRAVVIPSAFGPRRFGDIMQPFQAERFAKLAPSLVSLAQGENPPIGKFWLEAVKGNSKTSDLALLILWILAFAPRTILAQVGAADADQAGELRKAAVGILGLNPWLAEVVTVQTSQIVCQRTGSACEILSADVAGSHGARPHLLILDEIVHVTKTEFLENLLDNASKMPNGLVIISTNAGHLKSWAWRLRELARGSTRWLFDQRTEPSPWLDREEIEEAKRRNTPTRFNRLWRGIWSPGGGDALDPDDLAACIVRSGPTIHTQPGCTYVGGLDLSSKRDHSAFVLLGCDGTTQKVHVADCRSWAPVAGRIDLDAVRTTVMTMARRFGATIYFDPHEGSLLSQDLRQAGVHCEEVPFVASNLHRMASCLLQTVRERRLELYNDDRLIDDLQRLNIVEKAFGAKLEASRDENGHADRGFALAIALPYAIEQLSYGGIIDGTGGAPVEIEGFFGGRIPSYQGNPPDPFAPPGPSNLPGFGGGFGGSISRF